MRVQYQAYWASESDQKKLIQRSMDRFAWHMSALASSGRLDRLYALHSAYYGYGADGNQDAARLYKGGDGGQLTRLHINKIKPLLQNVHSIITQTRPAVKPVSSSGDAKSTAQTRLAAALHAAYDQKLAQQELEEACVLGGLQCSSYWLVQEWKTSAGEPEAYDEETEQVKFQGDAGVFTVPPWRMAADCSVSDESERRWVLFRRLMPLHDLAARIVDPVLQEKLLCLSKGGNPGVSSSVSLRKVLSAGVNNTMSLLELRGETPPPEDAVWVWELRHIRTPALPLGRLVRFVEPDIVLFDSAVDGGAYPYASTELHAYEYCPERVSGSLHGYSPLFGALGLQEFYDICATSIATTVDLAGVPHLWTPPGDGAPTPRQLSTGPVILETAQEPKLISFPALKPEVVEAAEFADRQARLTVALNDTVMGSPPTGMPASAQALQRAQAVQYHSGPQRQYVRLVRNNANGRLRLLQRFAKSKRVAQIAGAAGAYELREWTSGDIEDVPGFDVEVVSPASASFEGRLTTAEMIGIKGEALLDFLATGSLRKVTQNQTAQQEIVDRNRALLERGVGLPPVDANASMIAGEPVFVDDQKEHVRLTRADPHHLAIPSYLSVLNVPDAREDPERSGAVLQVVSESLRLWRSLTPDECFAFGIPPLPSQMQGPAMEPTDLPGPEAASRDMMPAEPETELPKPPADPITGQEQSDVQP